MVSRQTDEVDFWQLFPGDDRIDPMNFSAIWSGDMEVENTGSYMLKFSYQGLFRLYINDAIIASDMDWHDQAPYAFYTIIKEEVHLKAGHKYAIRLELINTPENERNAMIMKALYMKTETEIAAEIKEALELVESADQTIIFAGHAPGFEQEGVDRDCMTLPGHQNRLIEAVCNMDSKAVVVLTTGAPIEMPWSEKAGAILQTHFYGQEGGNAIGAVLCGEVNPSGRLSTTYPLVYEDNPSFKYYPGGRECVYGEGIYVGYRYYDTRSVPVRFPFGHGLSYTDFKYSNMKCRGSLGRDKLTVEVDVTNVGQVYGQEVVQLYISATNSTVARPIRELKGFDKVELEPEESKRVSFELDKRAFSYYDDVKGQFTMEKGLYKLQIGKNSRDIIVELEFLCEFL